MKQKAILGLLAGGLMAFSPVAASAAIVVVTYTGTVANGTDGLDLFSSSGGSLAGESYSAVYTYNTATPGAISNKSATSEVIYGGSQYGGAASPIVSATLTIGGVTQSFASTYANDGGYWQYGSQYYFETIASAVKANDTYTDLIFDNYSSVLPKSFPYTGSLTPALTVSGIPGVYAGNFDIKTSGASTSGQFGAATINVSILSSVTPTVHGFTPFSPAPEPAAWTLMILGFGGIGGMLRRKSARAKFAAA